MNYFGVEMPGKFSEFGSNLIQGLINGVSSMFPKLTSSISGVAESVVGTFKSLLGIHSPSRVFAGLGGFTMEGLEQGLQQGQSGPLGAVKSLGQQLTEAGVGSIKLTSDLETNLPTGKKGPFDALASIGKELPNARAGAAGLTSGLGHGLPTGKKGPFDALADIGKGLPAVNAGPLGAKADRPLTMDNRPPLSASPPAGAASTQAPAPIIIQVHAAPVWTSNSLHAWSPLMSRGFNRKPKYAAVAPSVTVSNSA